jgi:hydroxymethylpyrimidine/phosphomethylpyrimidine kinase
MSETQDRRRYCRVLTIAGSDSGGGAGIQADLKTISALGCYGMSAITAITAQNTMGVSAIESVPIAVVDAQIDAVVSDIGVDAVKIGMLHTPAVVRTVAGALRRHGLHPVVLDPVMVATSGDRLITKETIAVLVEELFGLCDIVTPNLDEAAVLLGRTVKAIEDLEPAVQALGALGCPAVLLKGGHLPGDTLVDMLMTADGAIRRYSTTRIETRNVHGTGCSLSAAIAAHLALGSPLVAAVEQARDYVIAAIAAGAGVVTGAGHGPLNHFFAPRPLVIKRQEPGP